MKKQITKKHPEGFIRISLSTERNYFSITGDIHSRESFSDGSFICGGCIHDEILAVSPELKPLVDLHLSTLDGVPMHAEANGWFWLAKAAGIPQKWEPEQSELDCFAFFTSHSRMTGLEAHELVKKVKFAKSPRMIWVKAMDGLRPRWKSEADSALFLLESL